MSATIPSRARSTLVSVVLLWVAFYASFTLFTPPLLDDADSVHAEVAREMLLRHDYVTLYANGIRYLEKAPLMYWSMAATMRVFQIVGAGSARCLAVAARIPLALAVLALALLVEELARRMFRTTRAGLYAALITLSSFGIFIFSRILIPDVLVCLFTTLALYAFWRTEEIGAQPKSATPRVQPVAPAITPQPNETAPAPQHQVPQAQAPQLRVIATETAKDSAPAPEPVAASRRIHVISSRNRPFRVISGSARRSKEMRGGVPTEGGPAAMHHSVAPQLASPAKRPSLIWSRSRGDGRTKTASPHLRLYCGLFAVACALNVLTKGLIGVVFPIAIVVIYLLVTRGRKRGLQRLRELHPWATLEAFLFVAAPWHILAGLANPTEGSPAAFRFVHLHWLVPMPALGNVHGWFWFYFMNEHVLRYLNLRVPHDYDTSPLWLFWGLCLIWMMPWSGFAFKAVSWAAPFVGGSKASTIFRSQLSRHDLPLKRRGAMLLLVWAAFVLLFFSFSTRQEYYVLPALPAVAVLVAAWLAQDSFTPVAAAVRTRRVQHPVQSSSQSAVQGATRAESGATTAVAALRVTAVLLLLGAVFATAAVVFLMHAVPPGPHADLASLLSQNPADYALSMGHFLDLDTRALGLFRLPLLLAALSLFFCPLGAYVLRRRAQPHAANLALATGAFGFLLAAHLGLQTFAPVLTSAQLAEAIAPQVQPQDMIAIHGEYESGSSLGFYLQRPASYTYHPGATNFIHILDGRSSNLWYGSFFSDAPPIFETDRTFAERWAGPRRIFLWQSVTDPPSELPKLNGPVYVLATYGGKEIVSNQPNTLISITAKH